MFLDGAKGAVAVLIARLIVGAEDAAQLAGLAAFLGHLYPVWLGFKGGKGVATFLGMLLALAWPVGLAACATWAVGAVDHPHLLGRRAAGGGSVARSGCLAFDHGRMLILVLVLTVLIYVRHAANLVRIKAGTEPKIGRENRSELTADRKAAPLRRRPALAFPSARGHPLHRICGALGVVMDADQDEEHPGEDHGVKHTARSCAACHKHACRACPARQPEIGSRRKALGFPRSARSRRFGTD